MLLHNIFDSHCASVALQFDAKFVKEHKVLFQVKYSAIIFRQHKRCIKCAVSPLKILLSFRCKKAQSKPRHDFFNLNIGKVRFPVWA